VSAVTAARNLSAKALRRLLSAHKPFVRRAHQRARARELDAIERRALAVEDELEALARGRGPIVAGPWLGEVGYEVLYWIPFLRWFQHAYRVAPDRLVALSRGGTEGWYDAIAGRYLDLFDWLAPADLAALNERRRRTEEGGGRKQSAPGSAVEAELIARARSAPGLAEASALSPSLMFRLFRDVWHGTLAPDVLWHRTRYRPWPRPPRLRVPELPSEYVAVKLYTGVALPDDAETRDLVRALVGQIASRVPVVALETGLRVDDHGDFGLADLANVRSARAWSTPRTNLAVQTALIAHARWFVGTCGGLAWLAPFLDVPTTAVYVDDRLLTPHVMLARQAGARAGAADFSTWDLRVMSRLGLGAPLAGAAAGETN
jgi:hypothetical protein